MASWSSQRRCRPFTMAEIDKATDSFNGANYLGKGGEGTVFKGVVSGRNGTSYNVAVKRLTRLDSAGAYEKEIKMLSELHHPNLVSLVGYCQHIDKKMLVYDFMANGSLRDNLYRKPCSLTWEQRLNICIGAARGLEFLHTGAGAGAHKTKIIHRDVKPDNILLDANFAARISDFGLSKTSRHSWVSTALGRGTRGYYAPELSTCRKITWRVDVFAFGVVLFEVLCKKRPWELQDDSNANNEDDCLGKWAQHNVDPDLKGTISQSCLEAFIEIGEKCLAMDPEQRPSMTQVVSKLIHASQLQNTSRVANGEKRHSDKTFGDSNTSSKSKLEKTTSADHGDGFASVREKSTGQEGGGRKSSVEQLENSTKAAPKESKSIKQETQAYKYSSCSQNDKYSNPIWEDGKIQSDFMSSCSGGEATNKDDSPSRRHTTTSSASGISSSSTTLMPPDIPGTEDKVVLFYSYYTSTSEDVKDYFKVRMYLKTYDVDIKELDPTMNEKYQVELSRFLAKKQINFSLPQLFIGGKHIGGADQVVQLHDSGQLGQYLALYRH